MSVPTPGPPPVPADPRGPSVESLRADVAEALADLDGLAQRPPAEHVEAFERVHAALGDALSAGSA